MSKENKEFHVRAHAHIEIPEDLKNPENAIAAVHEDNRLPAATIYNVMITRKPRAKPMITSMFSITVPEGENPHEYVRSYIRTHYPTWMIAGYAPALLKRAEDEELTNNPTSS